MKAHGDSTWTSGLIPMIEPEMSAEIIARMSDLTLVISPDGIIQGILSNPSFETALNLGHWEGRPLSEELTEESVEKFRARMETFLRGEDKLRPLELNHRDSASQLEFPIRYALHRISADGTTMMLGQDLRPIAEMQQQLVAAQMALEQDYEAQREYDTRFRVLMSSTTEATLFVSVTQSEIVECNAAAEALLGKSREDLISGNFSQEFESRKRGEVIEQLLRMANAESGGQVTLTLKRSRDRVIVRPVLFRSAGEQMLLCRMSLAEGDKAHPDQLTDNLIRLYNFGVDPIVFVAPSGAILSANEAFIDMAGVTNANALKGQSIADFMGRGTVDLNVLLDNAARSGSMRLYATRLVAEHGGERAVEISTSHLTAKGDPVFALMIRDATRMEKVRPPSPQITDVDMRSVIELIGNQSLKDIVSKTTDVVEKMCIETAVELTSNNRVAAADMLGLSRQSLYVKLRKYDLL